MEAFVEVVDDVPVISFHNSITVSKVPLDVVTEGHAQLLFDAGQIPSGFGTRVGCLVILDEGGADVLPAIDRAGRKGFQPVESPAAHHDREVRRHDVVVAIGSSNSDGGGAQPRLGVGLAIEFLDADRLEGRWPLDGSQPVGEGGEAIEVVRRVLVVAARLMIAVVAVGTGCAMFFVVAATSFPLGDVPLTMAVGGAGSKITAVEVGTEIRLVDLLIPAMGAY